MKNNKRKSVFIAVVFAVFVTAFFCPKTTKAFEDSTAPEITSLSVAPTEINTTNQGQVVTITIGVKDTGVGICSTGTNNSCDLSSANKSYLNVKLAPLISTQFVEAYFTDFTRVSGDDNEGLYTATKTISYGSKVGIWQVDGIMIADKIGNQAQWNNVPQSSDSIVKPISAIPNASGLTIANTAESSSVKIEKAWTLSSSKASVTFPLNTIVTKTEGGSFAFYQMVNQDFSIGDVTTDGLDTTNTSDIAGKVKIGIPGLNLSFSKSVTLEFNVGSQYDGQTLEIQTLEESGSSWANETTCKVSSGKCSFTVNHASYFAAIKTTASSTSNGTVTGSTNGNIVVGTDTSTLNYSASKKAKKIINLTFNGLTLTKKQWVKVRLNGRKVTTVRVRRSGNNSVVAISFKYRKWAIGNYNLTMTYKNQIKIPYIKKGKTKYRKGWENGGVNSENILSII